ncbi:DUF805 domain-containing protein [Ideonella azotifigens]|uniref:DUF805 domain-containing protein n=3 Tax=Ideonella azotifigens TaxID=513160 RepID=A0ABP3VL23_9BURK|nr:DUF805 domain-containing protein [Ideonella azotifigens]MCD2344039.1 DUF805 domain-containing protein [Ideonella azotifigens]
MQDMVRLVYAGEILEGHAAATVQQSLAEWLKLDDTRRAALGSGRRLVIKKALAADQAHKWVAQFKARGARLLVEPLPPEAAAPTPAAVAPLPTIAPPPVATASAPFTLELAPLEPPTSPAPPPWAAPRADANAAQAARGPDPAAVPPPIKTIAPASDEMMDCPACGERQSKRILCKACACDMPRGIAAKEEAAAEARAEREAQAQARREARGGPRKPPATATERRRAAIASRQRGEEPTPYFGSDDAPLFGLSFEGRMPRMRYFFSGLLFYVGIAGLGILLALLPGMIFKGLLGIVGIAVLIVWSLRVTVLRLHDIGQNGWWVLVLLIPIINWIATVALLFYPSEAYENEHGPKPVDDSGRGVVIALGVLILMFALLLSLAVPAYKRYVDKVHEEMDDDERPEAQQRSDDPMPSAAELQSVLHSPRAAERFREEYAHAKGHRAFSVSNDGASGWASGASSIDTAVREALASCDHDRRAYTSECYIVHVDTDWAMR